MSFSTLKAIKSFRVIGAAAPFSGSTTASIMFTHTDLGSTLLECGSGVYAVLRKTDRVRRASSVVVTSLHDHSVADLQSLLLDRWWTHSQKTNLYMPPGLLQPLKDRLEQCNVPQKCWRACNQSKVVFQSTTDLWVSGMKTYAVLVEDRRWSLLWSSYCSLPIVTVMQRDNPGLFNSFSTSPMPLVMQDVTLKTHQASEHCHYTLLDRHLDDYQHFSFGHRKEQSEKLRRLTDMRLSCLSLWNN